MTGGSITRTSVVARGWAPCSTPMLPQCAPPAERTWWSLQHCHTRILFYRRKKQMTTIPLTSIPLVKLSSGVSSHLPPLVFIKNGIKLFKTLTMARLAPLSLRLLPKNCPLVELQQPPPWLENSPDCTRWWL